jgi:hypothetical protein
MIYVPRPPSPTILTKHGQTWLAELQKAQIEIDQLESDPGATKERKLPLFLALMAKERKQ